MKNQKILFYLFKWLALIFLVYLIIQENHSKFLMLMLIGLVCGILIWEGIRDFKKKGE
jgi:ABC-type enterochelin transport system permease subunit